MIELYVIFEVLSGVWPSWLIFTIAGTSINTMQNQVCSFKLCRLETGEQIDGARLPA